MTKWEYLFVAKTAWSNSELENLDYFRPSLTSPLGLSSGEYWSHILVLHQSGLADLSGEEFEARTDKIRNLATKPIAVIFNELGELGWELVSSVGVNLNAYIFKRPKP